MKYKILISITLVAIVAILMNINTGASGETNGAVAGATGSPGDGASNTCGRTGCHNGTAITPVAGWITSTIPASGYIPGTTYTITATATYTALVRYGFEISPQNSAGNLIGTLINTGANTQLLAGGKYITHTSAGTTGSTGSHTWTFNWTAPPSGTGAFTFYGAFNCTNNDTHDTGDKIYTSTLAVTEDIPNGIDCGVFAITNPSVYDCSGNIAPVVMVGNYGSTTLTDCDITYFMDANGPSVYHWTGSLTTGAFASVTLPSMVSSAGAHTFTASTTAPNGATDIVLTNDTRTVSYTTTTSGLAMPFFEGFESTAFPPTNWTRKNPDNATTWARSTTAHKTGVGSAYMNNWTYSTGMGQRDELDTNPIDLTSMANPGMSFQVAHKFYSATYTDTLTVLISTDCGVTWNQLYKKFGTALATITATGGSTAFTPTSTQWRQEMISLSAYSTCSTALFRFINGGGNGNNVFLDDINIGGGLGVDDLETSKPQLKLYPNPVNDILSLEYSLSKNSAVSIKIYNLQGKEISELVSDKNKSAGKYSTIVDTKLFNAGAYFITISDGENLSTKKVMVIH